MTKTFAQLCRCRTVELHVTVPRPGAGTRLRCYCRDCQTAARLHEGGADVLAAAGGTDIWQTTPDRIEFIRGAECLEVIRLSPNGLFRWHAGCCGTLLINTLPNLALPFAGVVLRQSALAEAERCFGPVRGAAGTKDAVTGPSAPSQDRGIAAAGLAVVRRMLGAVLRRAPSPLRGSDGAPIAPVRVISLEARKAAQPDHLR